MNENKDTSSNLFIWFFQKFGSDRISVHAAHVAFFIFASLIPFLMFLITFLSYTPLTEDYVLTTIQTFIPSRLQNFFVRIMEEVYSSSGTLLSLTVIGTLWAGSKGFSGIAFELDTIYESKRQRDLFICRLESIFYTIVFTVMIITSLILLVYGNQIVYWLTGIFPLLSYLNAIVFILRSAVSYLILTLYFLLMYRFIPNHKTTFRNELPGAGLTAFLWIVFSYLYSFYIDSYGSSFSLYGSLTMIVLMMIWLYFCINIIFIGAMLNRYLAIHDSLNLTTSIRELPSLARQFVESKKQ